MESRPVSRFHKLIPFVERLLSDNPGAFNDEMIIGMLRAGEQAARQSALFVLGDMTANAALDHHGAIEFGFPCHLPYPITIIEYDAPFSYDDTGQPMKEPDWRREIAILFETKTEELDKDGSVLIGAMLFTLEEDRWMPNMFIHEFAIGPDSKLYSRTGAPTISVAAIEEIGRVRGFTLQRMRELVKPDVSFMGAFLYMFLQVLQCNNIHSQVNQPPVRLVKAQRKRGVRPMFAFRTLHVQHSPTTEKRQQSAQALRNSPRLHFRRGHVRKLASGKLTWVSQCMVGDENLGVVGKQYSL